MSIPVIRALLFSNKVEHLAIDRPEEIENKAMKLALSGYKFYIIALPGNMLAAWCCTKQTNDDGTTITEIFNNEYGVVSAAIDTLVVKSFNKYLVEPVTKETE